MRVATLVNLIFRHLPIRSPLNNVSSAQTVQCKNNTWKAICPCLVSFTILLKGNTLSTIYMQCQAHNITIQDTQCTEQRRALCKMREAWSSNTIPPLKHIWEEAQVSFPVTWRASWFWLNWASDPFSWECYRTSCHPHSCPFPNRWATAISSWKCHHSLAGSLPENWWGGHFHHRNW